jgi:hypothetical protein
MKRCWCWVLGIAVLFCLYGGARTYECDCVPPRFPSEEFTKSDAVFSGKVVRIYETTRKEPEIGERVSQRAVVFSVDRTWKGINETHVVVYTGFGGGDCGYPFEVGKEYLVMRTTIRTGSQEFVHLQNRCRSPRRTSKCLEKESRRRSAWLRKSCRKMDGINSFFI